MYNLWLALGAFVALAVLDFIWAGYVKAVSSKPPLVAALWAIPVYGVGASVTVQVVHQPWIIIPACAGCFVGTFVGVWLERRKKHVRVDR